MFSVQDLMSHVVLPSTVTDLKERLDSGRLSNHNNYVSYSNKLHVKDLSDENISPKKSREQKFPSFHKSRHSLGNRNSVFRYKHHSSKSKNKNLCRSLTKEQPFLHPGLQTGTFKTEVQCPDCCKVFLTEIKLPENISGLKKGVSTNCNNYSPQKSCLSKNLPAAKDPVRYECSICERMFSQKENYTKHLNCHLNLMTHKCSICSMSFSNKSLLIEHYVSHKVHICKKCNKSFQDNWKLNRHLKTHMKYQCKICKIILPKKSALDTHMLTHVVVETNENVSAEKSDVSNVLILTTAGTHDVNISPEKSDVVKQVLTHTVGETCESNGSLGKSNFMNFVLTHTVGETCEGNISLDMSKQAKPILTGIPEETVESNVSLTDKSNLGTQMLIHSTGDIWTDSTSPVKSDLVKYIPPSSEACDSNNISVEESNLPNNVETRVHEIPEVLYKNTSDTVHEKKVLALHDLYKCTFCNKIFKDKGKLKQHMIIHTGERTHLCNICNRKFHYKWRLTQHIKNCHNNIVTISDVLNKDS